MAKTTAKASVASKKASLVPTSFGDKFIRFNLSLATPALKAEFPGYTDVRITSYIGGYSYINLGTKRDDTIESVKKTAKEMKAFLTTHNLQNIVDTKIFGQARQIVGQRDRNPEKALEAAKTFETSRLTIA